MDTAGTGCADRSLSPADSTKIRIMGSAPRDGAALQQYESSHLINDWVAVDTGYLGFYRTAPRYMPLRASSRC